MISEWVPRVGDRVEFASGPGRSLQGRVFRVKITPRTQTVSIRTDDNQTYVRTFAGVTPVTLGPGHDAA